MLRPRIIPCLLVRRGGLVKTVRFADEKYVGDPINAVRIFNEKEVDELVVLDIDATRESREPDYSMIANLAAECRMPLCYGGGVKSVDQFQRIIGLGVEKVALSSAAIESPDLVGEASRRVGNQSVVVVLDVRRESASGAYRVFTHNGTKASGLDAVEAASRVARLGAGEVVVNSIDRDGSLDGYDLDLMASVRKAVGVPLTALGGAGSIEHMEALLRRIGIAGAAAGSLFVFKGVYRAVLINYPNRRAKDALCREPAGAVG